VQGEFGPLDTKLVGPLPGEHIRSGRLDSLSIQIGLHAHHRAAVQSQPAEDLLYRGQGQYGAGQHVAYRGHAVLGELTQYSQELLREGGPQWLHDPLKGQTNEGVLSSLIEMPRGQTVGADHDAVDPGGWSERSVGRRGPD